MWPPIDGEHIPEKSQDDLVRTAWEIRQTVSKKIMQSANNPHGMDCWNASIQDVDMGFAVGPFYHEHQVSEALADDH